MDENTVKFEEKLKELVEFAKRKKGTLENQKIMEFFSEVDLDPDQMDHIYEVLENNNIDITGGIKLNQSEAQQEKINGTATDDSGNLD